MKVSLVSAGCFAFLFEAKEKRQSASVPLNKYRYSYVNNNDLSSCAPHVYCQQSLRSEKEPSFSVLSGVFMSHFWIRKKPPL